MSGSSPVRSCIGCGARASRDTLVRVVLTATGLGVDHAGRLPGRGGYLHRDAACWAAFVRRRGQVRSLRATPPVADRERLVRLLAGEEANPAR